MTTVVAAITISLDGYITGPNDGPDAAWAMAASDCSNAAAPGAFGRVPSDLLRLPDASGSHVLGAGNLPQVRDEAGARRHTPGVLAEAA
jgi:hypothetical protein